ncbi:SgcJ/EcaC family oxidoreductase [Cuspidothrix issatschenkoi LEGE 03284]|uniref:YybH family protein n=1 Tax=Cuspidothrix issatschenkoi TaxID=230752 RepID=UPI0018807011|nr:SgcJ/EcaC family oxidoreductase [Cuspidothrix issatschenkoi]MBE9230411.1 SgcJ/EcaC family oxidoreductase [Cuspidothrix issatschenkoi LEGE 03284]
MLNKFLGSNFTKLGLLAIITPISIFGEANSIIGSNSQALASTHSKSKVVAYKAGSKDADKIKMLFEKTYAMNLKTGDVNTYMTLFTKDAVWIPPGRPDKVGPKDIGEAFANQASAVNIDAVLTADEIKVMGNFAYIIGTSVAKISPKDGSPTINARFRVLWLMQKEQGKWKIAREIWNTKP